MSRTLKLVQVLICLTVAASACSDPFDDAPPEVSSADCLDADSDSVSAIADGLTVRGGASLRNAQTVALNPPVGNVKYVVAADIQGNGMEGQSEVAAWGVGGIDGEGPIWALDSLAMEFSSWLSAANEGSPADQQRDEVAGRDETATAKACVGGA